MDRSRPIGGPLTSALVQSSNVPSIRQNGMGFALGADRP